MTQNVAIIETLSTYFVAKTEIPERGDTKYLSGMLSKWLRQVLENTGISQAELARLLSNELHRSIDRAAVNKMASGLRQISGSELLAIAKITGVEAPAERIVPLVGRVGAGQSIEAINNGDADFVPAPADARPDTVAVEIIGDSMFPAYEQGTLLYYSRKLPPNAMLNKRCVVQLEDGRVFVKVLRPGKTPGLWTLQSYNAMYPDIEDVAIEWTAPIEWIRPR